MEKSCDSIWTSQENLLKQLFIVDIGENKCVTHDGYIQIGIFNHSVEKHLELNPVIDWQVTYWMPDIFTNRYKGSAEFNSKPRGCNKLEDK